VVFHGFLESAKLFIGTIGLFVARLPRRVLCTGLASLQAVRCGIFCISACNDFWNCFGRWLPCQMGWNRGRCAALCVISFGGFLYE
jgi:hypothetical protein